MIVIKVGVETQTDKFPMVNEYDSMEEAQEALSCFEMEAERRRGKSGASVKTIKKEIVDNAVMKMEVICHNGNRILYNIER